MADILYSVGFQLEDKQIANSLAGIRQDIENAFNPESRMTESISKAVVEAKSLEKAMKRATTDKGISYYSLQAELRKCGTSAAQLTTNLAMGGERFRNSLNAANVALATSNRTVLSLNSKIQEMARVFKQSFKFTMAQTALREITKMAQQAVGWVKSLNSAVNAIGVVTGKSAAELEKITEASIVGAKNLKIAADEYAKAALIFYQQGLGDEEVAQRTEITIKAAKAAGVAVDEMSQQLTAIWNTYGMIGEEQANAASVGAKLAASTAADFADIAEAMQTSASAASQMGVSYNSLASIIATVKDVTQQSASTIGNAYKTIFSRFEQLKSAGTDGEVTLNRVSQQLEEMGIHVLDSSGELRELDDVIMELGNTWGNYTQKQQLAIAETVGGTRQYGQFLALMQNFDKYQKNLDIANAETGADTLEQQYSQAMNSVEEKMNIASESWKRAFGEIINEDQLKAVYDISNDIANVFGGILKGAGGLPGILSTVAAMLSSKIGPTVSNMAANASVLIGNLTKSGRDRNIDKEKDREVYQNDYRRSQLEAKPENLRTRGEAEELTSLNIQKQKLEVSRQTAHAINEIDTATKKAGGNWKIQLESMRDTVKAHQELYQLSIDRVDALKNETAEIGRQQKANQRALEEEKKRLQLISERANERLKEAKTKQGNARKNVAAKEKDVEKAKQDKATAEQNVTKAQQRFDAANQNPKTNKTSIKEMQTAQEELRKAQEELQKTEQNLTRTEEKLQKAQDGLAAADSKVKTITDSVNEASEELANFEITSEIDKEFIAATQEANEMTEAVRKFAAEGEESGVGYIDLGNRLEQADQELRDLIGDQDKANSKKLDIITDDELKQLEDAKKKVNDLVDSDNIEARKGALAEYLDLINKIKAKRGMIDEQVQGTSENLLNNTQEMIRGQNTINSTGQRAAEGPKPEEDNPPEPQKIDVAGALGGLAQVATAAVTAMNAVKNLYSVMSNPDATISEKLSAIGTSLLTLLPAAKSAASGIKMISTALHTSVPIVAAVIAGLTALIALFAFLAQEAENKSPEGRLKAAQAAAEALTEAEQEAKKEADNLRNAFDKYTTAKEKLENCKRGTEEWTEALKEANDAALEVLNNMPDNYSADQIKALYEQRDGRLQLNEEGVKAVQKDLDTRAATAGYATEVGKIEVTRAANDVREADLIKDVGKATGHIESYGDSATYVEQSSKEITEIIKNHLQDLNSAVTDSEFKEKLGEFGVQIEYLDNNEISNLRSSLTDLATKSDAVEAKFDVLSRLKTDEILGDDYSDAEKNYAANELQAETDRIAADILGDLTNGTFGDKKTTYTYGDISKGQTEINQKLLDRFNAATGNNWTSSSNGVQGTDSARFFEFLDDQGELHKLSAKQVATQIAAAEALATLGDSAKEAREGLGKLEEASENAKTAIEAREKAGDTSGPTKQETEAIALSDAVSGYLANGNMNDMTKSQLDALNGDNAQELFESLAPELQAYFGEGEEAFQNFQEAIKSSLSNITEAANGSVKSVQIAFADLLPKLGDISADTADTVVKALEDGFRTGGVEGMKDISDTIAGLGEDGAAEFQEIYDSIDWANPDIDTLNEMLVKGGMTADEAAAAAEKLTKALKKQTEQTVESAQAAYAEGNKITDKLEQYDTVSPEDIQKLQEMGIATDLYFQELADGTSMLTMDASQFKNIVDQINLGKMQESVDALQEQYNTLAAYKDVDVDSLDMGGRIDLLKALQPDNEGIQTAAQEYYAANSRYESANTAVQDAQTSYHAAIDRGDTKLANDYLSVDVVNKANAAQQAKEEAEAAKQRLDEIWQEANVSEDLITNTLNETAADIAKAQEAIAEANFQNAVQEYGLDLEETANYAEVLAEEFGYTEAQAKKLAIANQRLDRGCTDLNKNFSDYKKTLKDENRATAEYAKTLKSFKSSLADVLNVSEDVLSNKFAKKQVENSELLEKAIAGDAEALAELKKEASLDIGDNILEGLKKKADELGKAVEDADPKSDAFAGLKAAADEATAKLGIASSAWDTLKGRINSGIGDMPVGEFETAMNTLITEAGMTYEQVTSLLGSMGVDADVETKINKETRKVPTTIEEKVPIGTKHYEFTEGDRTVSYDIPKLQTIVTPGPEVEAEGYFPTYSVKVKSGNTESGGKIDTSTTLNDNGSILPSSTPSPGATSPGDTGGGSKSKPKSFEKGEYHQRYTDTKQKLDSVSKAMEKYQSAADDSVGPKKLANMRKANALLAKQGQLYNNLYKEALSYAKADKKAMQDALSVDGITLKFNEDDTLANLEEVQRKWDEMLNATDLNGNGLLDENEEELYESTKEHIEEQQKLIDKYVEAVDEMNQALQDAVDNVRNYMNAKTEEINIRIEANIKPLERDIDSLSRSIEFLGQVGLRTGKTFELIGKKVDDIEKKFKEYQSGANDAGAQIADIQSSLTDPSKMKEYIDTHGAAAWQEYLKQNGGVPAEALQAMEDNVDNIAATMDEAYDALDELYSAYSELFQSFIDEFDLINGRLENNYKKLELYEKIYEASGDKSTERKEAEATLASTKRKNKEQSYKVAQNTRDTYKDELARRQKAYDDFMKENGFNTKNFDESQLTEAQAIIYNRLKESVTEAQKGLQDAESQVMSTFEDVLDAAVEEAEKKTALARAQFVESISNGMFNDFEMLSTYYDDLEEKRKFYVDDYDKDYYLDKFDYQIDDYLKDANIVDPSRMAEWEKFQQRINDLRAEGVELTQAQIDKLQAEFELEKLKDQYEEAQNAKTTMRLTRDASGNYNYVYSSDANSEDAADIAQKIRDKEKEIRDMGKSIVEEMSNTYLETSKELEEYLAQNGGVADEHAMMLKERLDRIADQISQQCKETGIDFRTTSLGIISDTDSMEDCHEKFTESFIELEKKEQEANNEKAKVIGDNCTDIGIDYENLSDSVDEDTKAIIADDKAAGAAAKQLYTDTNTAMNNAAKSVADNSKKICANIQSMITAYENLIKEIKKYKELSEQDINLYDEDTDYTAKLYNEWLESGMSAEDFLKAHQGEVEERMFAAAERGVTGAENQIGDTVDETIALMAKSFKDKKAKGQGAYTDTTYKGGTNNSDGGSGKLGDTSNTKTTTTTTTTTTDDTKKEEPKKTVKYYTWSGNAGGKSNPRKFYAVYSDGSKEQVGEYYGSWESPQGDDNGIALQKKVSASSSQIPASALSLDTGGYTGEWGGDEGKIAILHKKELILNPEDTENILEAVREVRASVLARTSALNDVPAPSTTTVNNQTITNNENTPVQQDVKIDATFPNVNVASEVEDALSDLINKTAQYAKGK